jgi:AraC-like DNA-binding protein
MYEHAKENNNNIGMGIALFVMGRIYYDQNRLIEQEKCLREAIVVLKDSALNKLVDVYLHLGNCLIEQERYEEALQITAEMESVIKRYEDENGAPMPNARLNQYMIYTTAYVELKQYDKAEIYCEKVESMSNGTIIPYTARAAIFASRKQYDKALEMADKAIETAYPKYKLLTMKTKMSIWLKKEGNEKMEKLFTEIINLQISEHNEKMNAQLDEIRTQYEVDKITAENELNQVEKVRNRNYFLFALGGCLLLAITLGIWIYNNRIIVRKNRGLYLQIKEQDRLADELKAIKIQYEQISQLAPSDGDAEKLRATSLLPGNMQQRQLVARLHEYLLKDKYYSNYNIEIHQLVSEMATNRAFLFESIKVVTGKTLMEFLNDLRLDEAKRLLESSTLTIEAISLECGFNATRTFYRQFRERYRMSPTEYRRFTG